VSDVAQRFAENLSYYREQSGLTQEALANRAEIHRTQVGDLLRAKQVPRLDTLVKLAGALGVSPAKLVEDMSFEPAAQMGKFKFPPPKRKK
jgi:transcriptional regulator with XRE-family HTH domain